MEFEGIVVVQNEQFTCPQWMLSWSYRRQNLLQELLNYGADILCLQVYSHTFLSLRFCRLINYKQARVAQAPPHLETSQVEPVCDNKGQLKGGGALMLLMT